MTEGEAERRDRANVRSVERAIALLTVLAEHGSPLGVAEVAAKLGLHPATTHRMLATLVDLGWIEQNPVTSRYRLGSRMVAVGGLALAQSPLLLYSQDLLTRLAQATSFSAYIVVLVGDNVVYIDKKQPEEAGTSSQKGTPFELVSAPAHAMASGKLLLAHLPAPERKAWLEGKTLKRFTSRTITDPDELEQEFERIIARGYSIDRGERRDFTQGVAVPVRGPNDKVVAAFSCLGHVELTPDIEDLLRREASLAAEELGYRLRMMGD